jgi:hypothetical protein
MLETLKNLFRSRVKTRQPSSKPANSKQLPLGVSRDSLEQIQALTELTPYKHYLEALEALYENNVSAMLRGLSFEAYHFQCGVCFALEQIATLPEQLTNKARELDARHTAASPDTDLTSVPFLNSPFWDAYQRLGKRSSQYGGAGIPIPGQRNGSGVPER